MLALIVALFAIEFITPAIIFDFAREILAFLQVLVILRQQVAEFLQEQQLLELLQQLHPVLFLQQLQDRIVAGLDELLDPFLVFV